MLSYSWSTHCTHGPTHGLTHRPHTVLMWSYSCGSTHGPHTALIVHTLSSCGPTHVVLLIVHTLHSWSTHCPPSWSYSWSYTLYSWSFSWSYSSSYTLYSWSFSWSYSWFTHWTHGPTHGPTHRPHTVLATLYSRSYCTHCPHVVLLMGPACGPPHAAYSTRCPHVVLLMWSYSCCPTHGPHAVLMWSHSWVLLMVHTLSSSSTLCTHDPTHCTHGPCLRLARTGNVCIVIELVLETKHTTGMGASAGQAAASG